jgi:transcriptional regulator with XRE-family HTH domain
LKQSELAIKTGKTEGFISKILSGQARPGWELAKKISGILGTDIDLWMDGTPEQKRAALDAAKNGDE